MPRSVQANGRRPRRRCHRSVLTTIKANVDGLIYAMLTAGTFGWLWPR